MLDKYFIAVMIEYIICKFIDLNLNIYTVAGIKFSFTSCNTYLSQPKFILVLKYFTFYCSKVRSLLHNWVESEYILKEIAYYILIMLLSTLTIDIYVFVHIDLSWVSNFCWVSNCTWQYRKAYQKYESWD